MKQLYVDQFELESDEYIVIAGEHDSAKDYEIRYKGEVVRDAIAIIRKGK